MNTEEVVAMIDAITEGKEFRMGIETHAESLDDMSISTNSEGFSFFEPSGAFHAFISDPRTAREIAGALVAWANRKESKPLTDWLKTQAVIPMETEPTTSIPEEILKRQRAVYENQTSGVQSALLDTLQGNPRPVWREDWYRRSVGLMSQETKDRNLKDLREIHEIEELSAPERNDLYAAIQILIANGAK